MLWRNGTLAHGDGERFLAIYGVGTIHSPHWCMVHNKRQMNIKNQGRLSDASSEQYSNICSVCIHMSICGSAPIRSKDKPYKVM